MVESDFSMPEGESTTPTPVAPEAPAPLVVIQYRSRGLLGRLVPPLLILALAVGVTYYQRKKPGWVGDPGRPSAPPTRLASNDPPRPSPTSPAPAAVASTTEPKVSESPRAVAEIKGAPAAVAVAEAGPGPAPETRLPKSVSPFEIDPTLGLVPLENLDLAANPNPGAAPVTAPSEVVARPKAEEGPPVIAGEVPAPPVPVEPTPAQIAADIRREAAQNAVENKDIAALKPKALEMLRIEALEKVEGARTTFRGELKRILDHFKEGAGPEIEKLCQRFGRVSPPGTEELYHRGRRLLSPRVKRREEVDFMRSCGLPEPVILDFLSHKLHQTINTRGGPRDVNEVRVRAARMLLSYAPQAAASSASGTATARPLTSVVVPTR